VIDKREMPLMLDEEVDMEDREEVEGVEGGSTLL